MNILFIDDNTQLLDQARIALEEEGHDVETSGLGEEGLQLAALGKFQLVILDIRLPDRDGWSVLAEMKRLGVQSPVLVLTDQAEADDRVKGFDLGADDFLPKPFDFRELLGRVRAILRRTSERPNFVTAADVTLDLNARTVSRSGKSIYLAPNEFRTLLLLIYAKERAVTREEISEKVFGRKYLGHSNAIEVLLYRLRHKLDEGFRQERIRTVRGVGYAFVPTDDTVNEPHPE